jgi:hypothetical protein
MEINNDKEEIEFLISLDFKKEGFDDKSAFWFVKTVESKMLGKCMILVEDFNNETNITIDTYDKFEGIIGDQVTISYNIEYSRENVYKVISFLL